MEDRLTALDASFLELEQADECSHMHIGWAMVFDPLPSGGGPGLEQVRELLDERLEALPKFRKKLSAPRVGGLTWPHWQPDEHFDVTGHVRHAAMPAPGGDTELLEWLSDFYSHRLDRSRALWEMTLLEGLEGGHWALATKVHHCLVDGVSGASVTSLLLDHGPDQPSRAERPPEAPAEHAHGFVRRGVRMGVELARHPRHLAELFERAGLLAEFLARDELIPAARTSLNVPIGANRRLSYVPVPLDAVKAIKRLLGGSVNDVVLAVAAGGLRYLFEARGDSLPARGVRVMVPVNLRGASESLSLGNRVSSLFVELPVAEPEPITRYRKVVEATRELKESGLAGGAEALMEVGGFVPPVLHAQLARLAFTPRLFNLTITNVPGPPSTLYAFGAPLRRVIPIVPILALHAVGLAVASYDGEIVFGLSGDHAAMPDIGILAEGIERAFYELEGIVNARITHGQTINSRATLPPRPG
jgi:diacylglycerol O-acyltransferase / wax synthase